MSLNVLSHPTASSLFATASYGVGGEAQKVEDLLWQLAHHLASSSLGRMQQEAFRQLYEVLEECGRSNWDGYGAQPVSFETYEKAKRMITALPFGIPVPQISAEPDGEITFEWYVTPSRIFSISVGPNNELSYAGLFGASRTYGTEIFYDEIPQTVLSHIKRVVL